MSSGSIAKQATKLARTTLQVAFGGFALIATASIGTLLFFENAHRHAADRLLQAQHATDMVLLADERLTMSANMAAATGEQRWIARYDANIPMIDEAIAAAAALASPEVAQRFDLETREANDRLVAMESAAFDAVRADDLPRARAILDGSAYAAQKSLLSAGTLQFTDSLVGEVRGDLDAIERTAHVLLPLIALLAIGGAGLFWRRLNVSLRRSEAAILDAEGVIRDLATNDGLTGIANRRAIRDHLRASIERADRGRTKVAMMMIDLDHFKPVNDTHGHVVGDLVLKEVARRIASVLRHGEARARYGGDEFAVVIEHATEDGVRRVAHRLVEVLCQPMKFDEVVVQIGASIGIATFPTVASCDEDLLRKADVALYRAKSDGRGAVRVYDLSMEVEINERLQLERELRDAVKSGAITPYFLPQVNLRDGAITGFEILARWRHPVRGLLQPAQFMPLAEATGTLNDLTLAVLEAACEASRCLPSTITLSLNVAPQQIQDDWLAQKILAVLTKTGFSPRRLSVDVSETALVCDLAAAKRVITSLKNVGVMVALDDFGSAYSSLSYLSELPFDTIKIDSSFVTAITDRGESAKIVSAIIGLSKNLGVATVAESVETAAQADYLRSIGCDAAQGYFFHRPMPTAEAALLLAPRPDEEVTRAIA
ncbi:MAG: EAL domain-containing protein [Terricaulis sp.]